MSITSDSVASIPIFIIIFIFINYSSIKWKATPVIHVDYPAIIRNFKAYVKIVRKSIEVEKIRYFERTFETNKSNMKKTWISICESLKVCKIG